MKFFTPISAVNTWNANGQKNGQPPITATGAIGTLSNTDNTIAGLVTIPVCSAKEAFANWDAYSDGKPKSANYPCN